MTEKVILRQPVQHFEFVKQIRLSGKSTLCDVRPFFVVGKNNEGLFVAPSFAQAVQESNMDTIYVPSKIRYYDVYTNTCNINMKNAMEAFNEELLDLNIFNGREEAKIRFKFIATMISEQKAGTPGRLSNKHATIIGWMRLKDNNVYTLYVFWQKEPGFPGKWHCHADSILKVDDTDRWKTGKFFLKKFS